MMVFLHVETRRVFDSPATYHPNEPWVPEQAHALLKHVEETGRKAEIVMHDRDTKLGHRSTTCWNWPTWK